MIKIVTITVLLVSLITVDCRVLAHMYNKPAYFNANCEHGRALAGKNFVLERPSA